jgi:hypothetical protein
MKKKFNIPSCDIGETGGKVCWVANGGYEITLSDIVKSLKNLVDNEAKWLGGLNDSDILDNPEWIAKFDAMHEVLDGLLKGDENMNNNKQAIHNNELAIACAEMQAIELGIAYQDKPEELNWLLRQQD